MSILVNSNLEPRNSGAWPLTEDIHNKGGLRVVANVTERDAITTARRKQGMWVWVLDKGDGNPQLYGMAADLLAWDPISLCAGVLVMTTLQRLAIPDPSTGMQVFDTNLQRLLIFDGFTWSEA